MIRGSCLCGAVTFETAAQPQDPQVCHCGQCRKQSGHAWACAYVPRDKLTVEGPVAWYEASGIARRGFCPTCGSFLFWDGHDEDTVSFALGAVDGATGLTLGRHIFVADKGDYYEIADGIRQDDRE